MLKKFFISFLGSFAGICVAGILGFIFLISLMAVGAASGKGSGKVSIKSGSVLKIDLSGTVTDRYTPTSIIDRIYNEDGKSLALNDIVAAINNATTDKNIDGIYLECNGASVGLAQIEAIINALNRFKKNGKWIYAYGDNYTQGNYIIASTADSLFVNPSGMVDIHGLGTTVLYFKDLLDKIGVRMQVVKVGTYKSAVEPYILNDMSDPNREQLTVFLTQIWSYLTQTIAKNRGVDTTAVNKWADNFCYTLDAPQYVKEKIVDRTIYKREMEKVLAKATDEDEPNIVSLSDYCSSGPSTPKGAAKIAVLYAVGDISKNGKDGIASERIVPEIVKLTKNEKIDGLILRVNSPGGSAYASEQIWEALQNFKKQTGKPFYVSMGDYAASGGYYISCGADKIYAEPLTLTGSIGIFGLIPDAHTLLTDKLGVHVSSVNTNKGQLPNFFDAMTPDQAAAMQGYVNRGYELFTSRCAAGRHMSVDSIKAIAEGRVWDGSTALNIGLVDKLGGLESALSDMAASINKKSGKTGYTILEFPKVKLEWWEELVELNSQIRMKAVASELGEAAPYYMAIKNIKSMSPLQCRMEYIDIK